ncbi:MAG: imidazolonepropionase [Rectinemataceae bacterium]
MPKPRIDLLISGAGEVLTCVSAAGNPLGRKAGVVVAVAGEHIAAIAPYAELECNWDLSGARVLDARGGILAPGFIDCHTHLVFGGSRASEYAARMTRTAAEVKAMGIPTGIQATVSMTRAASRSELAFNARMILERMFRAGTTTLESKSGYGLSVQKEMELLEVNRDLDVSGPVDIVSTLLGAHDFPQDQGRSEYIDSIINDMIPQAAATAASPAAGGRSGLATFCDVYCDEGYYTAEESRRILKAGLRHGLRAKIHVDAYANVGGSKVAAELRAVSADHLNYTSRAEMAAYAKAGTVGVLMPGLDFAVRHPHPYDVRAMIEEGMILALATDFCPACWMESMQTVMQLACRVSGLSPEEALLAATAGAARALALEDRGRLEPGMLADLQLWDIPCYEDIVYRLGNNAVSLAVKRGRVYDFKEVRQ